MTPPALDRVVRICLAKDPEERWQSCRDVALELRDVTARSADAPLPRPRAGRLALATAGWVVAALLAVAGSFFPWAGPRDRAASRFRFLIPPPQGLAFQGMLALSPDGRTLAFVATGEDGRDLLYLRPLDSLGARALAETDGAAYPFWSPDGRSVGFFAKGSLKSVDVSSGSARTLCDAPGPRGGAWGSQGTIVFSAEAGGQMRAIPEAGGEPRPIAHLTSHSDETYRWPSFLPDGRHFLYYALRGDARTTGLWVSSLDSKEEKMLCAADSGAYYSSPGYLLYRTGDRLVARPFDGRKQRLTGEAVVMVEDVWWDGSSTFATAFAASPTGVLAYQTGGLALTSLILYDRSGREVGTLGPPGAYFEPTLSPDASRLAVSRTDGTGTRIWMIGLERGGFTRVSFQSAVQATPLWTPDGRKILFANYPGGEVSIHDVEGVEKDGTLFKPSGFSPLDDLSRDGRWLFREVVDWPTFRFSVSVRDMRSGSEQPVLKEPFNQLGARISPDGRWLAYESEESGVREVFVRSFPALGDRRQISTGGGSQARWRGDGKELFYASPDRKIMALDVATQPAFKASIPRPLFQSRILPTIEARNHYDVFADGQRFVVNSRRPEDRALPITVVTGGIPAPGKP
jgi:Tol biopolymer transport system component